MSPLSFTETMLFRACSVLFLNRIGHLVGLAVADADLALLIADDGEGGETETTAALDDLCATVDEDDFLDHPGIVGIGFLGVRTGWDS